MPRSKEKEYRVVTMSLSLEALNIVDKIRGDLSRTEFIEQLIFNAQKDKADLMVENINLKKKVKELEDKVRELQNIIDIQKTHERMLKEQLITNQVYEKLLEHYKNAKDKWEILGGRASGMIAHDVIQYAKTLLEEYSKDKVKEAIIRLFNDKGLSAYLKLVDDKLGE